MPSEHILFKHALGGDSLDHLTLVEFGHVAITHADEVGALAGAVDCEVVKAEKTVMKDMVEGNRKSD